jgi:hypothetical protein
MNLIELRILFIIGLVDGRVGAGLQKGALGCLHSSDE